MPRGPRMEPPYPRNSAPNYANNEGYPIRLCPWIEHDDEIDVEPVIRPSAAYSDGDDDHNDMVANWNALLQEEEADVGRLVRLREKARERGDINEAALLGMEIAKHQRLFAGIRERVQSFNPPRGALKDQGQSVQMRKGAAHQADLYGNLEDDGQRLEDRGVADRGYQFEDRMPSRVRQDERREQREPCGGGGPGRYERPDQTRVPGHEQKPIGYAKGEARGYYPGEGQWR